FMVAMGTSLADRAWGRESAVFRITGVISVIGGWFLTAGVAFIGAGIIVLAMHYGGHWAMFALGVLTVVLIIRSNRRFRNKNVEDSGDSMFQTILATKDQSQVWPLLVMYIADRQRAFLSFAAESYGKVTGAFLKEDVRTLDKADHALARQKDVLKSARRKETLCLRNASREIAIEKSAWFHLGNNCCMAILYNLRRISEVCKEHVDNNFLPLPQSHAGDFELVRTRVSGLLEDTLLMIDGERVDLVPGLRRRCEEVKNMVSDTYHHLHLHLQDGDAGTIGVLYVYLNMLQETREMVSNLRKYLRAYAKLRDSEFSGRS
ncbi:MAG: inorganic phosphate transporter, partial [Muribaculaceae bacterium]|nr:inorganic phosphate transporter [Muribaculaceae bacterium]